MGDLHTIHAAWYAKPNNGGGSTLTLGVNEDAAAYNEPPGKTLMIFRNWQKPHSRQSYNYLPLWHGQQDRLDCRKIMSAILIYDSKP